ncbi:hypothetical protein BAE44_0018540 [Dichanthelium oligosanthes]|uniref:Uncharacterized protein n=1 Tax=Dichanthelium oligosanthes TaxID=888268 RepID=A0A1E5V5K2_9POAL|nr:hypothetical protein BAE44_0018540 [Dichanthelium oligosanthes]
MCLAHGRSEDPWNSIVAGATTFGLANARRGAPAATFFVLLGAKTVEGIAGAEWTFELIHSLNGQFELNHDSPPNLVAKTRCRTLRLSPPHPTKCTAT